MLALKRILFLVVLLGVPGFFAWQKMHPHNLTIESDNEEERIFSCGEHADCIKITAAIPCNQGCAYNGGEAAAINKNYELEWQRKLTALNKVCGERGSAARVNSDHWTCADSAEARCKAGRCVLKKMRE